jgi:hypothetical protein
MPAPAVPPPHEWRDVRVAVVMDDRSRTLVLGVLVVEP